MLCHLRRSNRRVALQASLLFTCIAVVRAEQEDDVSGENEAAVDGDTPNEQVTQDGVMSGLCLFFGICISTFTVTFLFFSLVEHFLMRRYQKEGKEMEAKVLDFHFVRNATLDNIQELAATVEYRYMEVGGYTTLIRKQLQCYSTDLYVHNENEHEFVKVQFFPTGDSFSFDASEITFDRPIHRHISILVLDKYPNSGIPKNAVERTMRTWTQSAFLSLALFSISVFCIHLGLVHLEYYSTFGKSLAISVLLCVPESIGVCSFFSSLFIEMLSAEYLEGGEMLIKTTDDMTLGTISSSQPDDDFSDVGRELTECDDSYC